MRATPLQPRSSQRIASFLDGAAVLLVEVGYDAMTMTAVAERSGASIGALYRWFPDKASLAQELRLRYVGEMEHWITQLVGEAGQRSLSEFAEALIDGLVDFTRARPAWLVLQGITPRPPRDPQARRGLRETFATAFTAYAPHLSPERAFLIANVALEIVKGLAGTFRHATEAELEGVIHEFKTALTLYLSHALRTPG